MAQLFWKTAEYGVTMGASDFVPRADTDRRIHSSAKAETTQNAHRVRNKYLS